MKILAAVTAVLLISCTPTPVPQASALEQAKLRWNARGFEDYQFNYQAFCFCPRELTRLSRVEVRVGMVTKVTALESGEVLSADLNPYFPTVDALLSRLEQNLPLKPDSIFERVKVTFDATLGFPSKIDFIEKPIVADASSSHTVSEVRALE